MATVKSFTDLQQSKKLAEILPIESADMCYIAHSELINIHEPFYKKIDKDDIPCWGLAALLDILPNYQLQTQDDGIGVLCSCNGKFNIAVRPANPAFAEWIQPKKRSLWDLTAATTMYIPTTFLTH